MKNIENEYFEDYEQKDYKAINKLAELLDEAKIPYTRTDLYDGEKIDIQYADAVCHKFSYGHEDDLLEIQNGMTPDEFDVDSVLGFLTPEQVFERFKYCYENKTAIYRRKNEEISTNNDIKIIAGKNCSGKTKELIKESLDRNIPILVMDTIKSNSLKEKSFVYFGKTVETINYDELKNYDGKVLIDDLDEILSEILKRGTNNDKIGVAGFVVNID